MSPHDKEQQSKVGLKTYKQPRLQVYGNLRDITRAVGGNGAIDAGPKGSSKTSH